MSIAVETIVHAPLDVLWSRTQEPASHARWDLRFTRIEYLPGRKERPQRFLYATRIGFGMEIRGWGETVGERHRDGIRTSVLRFGSNDRRSLIAQGGGYWRYVPAGDGVRFATRYDYETRFGQIGKTVDRLFRPLMAWATAWSFDSLRRWLESGTPPEVQRRQASVHALARVTLAFVWIYHGLVPKLLVPTSGERELLRATGLFPGHEPLMVSLIGIGEIALGLLTLILWRTERLLWGQAVLLALLTLGALSTPSAFVRPFNPLTLNASLIALAVVGALAGRDLPSARNCRWSAR